jgi:flagellar assembly protein FliH
MIHRRATSLAPNKSNRKLNSSLVQYGKAYTIIASQEDNLASEESRKHLTKAQTEAQKLLQDALLQVDQTINNAQAEAAMILEQAQAEAQKIQNQAQEAGQQMGYDAGYQAGYNQAVEEAVSIISSAETIINGAYQAQGEILKNTENEMVRLVIAIAKKVIQKEIKMQPDIILRLTEAAIKELKDREEVKVMINPKQINMLTKASELFIKRINALKILKIVEDKSVPENGVIVESSSGKIDGRIDSQLEEIYNKLLDEAAANPAILDNQSTTGSTSDKVNKFLEQENRDLNS